MQSNYIADSHSKPSLVPFLMGPTHFCIQATPRPRVEMRYSANVVSAMGRRALRVGYQGAIYTHVYLHREREINIIYIYINIYVYIYICWWFWSIIRKHLMFWFRSVNVSTAGERHFFLSSLWHSSVPGVWASQWQKEATRQVVPQNFLLNNL